MRRTLDGVLLLDKPSGVGSNAALQMAKRLYRAAKAGHAGTLDPLASGLLPLLFGEATKFSQFALDADKEYLACVRLGIATTTGDAEGETVEVREVRVSEESLEPVLARFRGEIEQVPPMHSALKHGGRPLYELARQGLEVARSARRVRVHALDLLGFDGESLELRVRCSKGTYVRTLAEDLGRALDCGAHLSALRRVAAGRFNVADAATLESLEAETPEARDRRLLPPEGLLEGLPRVDLPDALAARFARGEVLALEDAPEGRCSVFAPHGRLLGLGEGQGRSALHPRRLVSHASG